MFATVSHDDTPGKDETSWDSLRKTNKSAFSEQKRHEKKGAKLIFKNFQHAML